MKLMIQGQDYTATLDAIDAITIERKLNEPSICQVCLSMAAHGTLAIPKRNQSLVVIGDNGTTYFTGYIAVTPVPQFAGMALEGPRYRYAVQALSDEVMLDQLPVVEGKGISGEEIGPLLSTLVAHTGSAALLTQSLTLNSAISQFIPENGAAWSKSAGRVANQARATYRAVGGVLSLASIPAEVHALNETDGSLTLANLSFNTSAKRMLANDITVCGEHEPTAYVMEYFLGDGVTTQFFLSVDPFFPPSSSGAIIAELFNEAAVDPTKWSYQAGSGYFSVGPSGLGISGGTGVDGAAMLTWLDAVEMSGTLLLEAEGVTLSANSTGILAGLYFGAQTQAGCMAGFEVTAQQGTGAVTIQPMIFGQSTGTTCQINLSAQYTLRVRVHCAEIERETAIYRSWGDSGLIAVGGLGTVSPANLLFEIQEFVNGVAGMPVVLYDGSIPSIAGSCNVVAASSINLIATMRSLNVTQLGSSWVVSTPVSGSAFTRRLGTVSESAECHIERTGKLAFYTGFAPAIGEQVMVSYRTLSRAVGRAVNVQSQQSLALAGMPSVAAWIGSVTSPAARSSADCRNAASCIVQAAASASAMWSGTYEGSSLSFANDVWPGDALLLNAPSANINVQVIVRKVKCSYRSSYPDIVEYAIAFANDWADDLAVKTSATVPADTWLPAPIAPTLLANLTGLTVTSITTSTVSVDTGVTAPVGGGFEIRRRDYCFMAGEDPDLVMRGPQSNLTFSRISANDRFYVRMYDGSTPPNYSEFSTALFINLPL
jgi:hypothetical protein